MKIKYWLQIEDELTGYIISKKSFLSREKAYDYLKKLEEEYELDFSKNYKIWKEEQK